MPDAQTQWPRMLIVDDIDDNRAILNRWFRRQGYDITEAANGPAALALLEQMTFDIVLLDIMMPNMCGIETLQLIRERYSAEQLPIMMVSARAETADVVDALELGANDYITKPVNFDIAKARVTTQVEQKRTLDRLDRSVTQLASTVRRLEHEVMQMRRIDAIEAAQAFSKIG